MRTAPRQNSRSKSRGTRPPSDPTKSAAASEPLRRNLPPEPRSPEQPGVGAPAQHPVTVTIRHRAPSRSGSGRLRRDWQLVFEATAGASLDPLTGRAQTTDPLAGHTVAFHTLDAAIAFATRKGWGVRVAGGRQPTHRPTSEPPTAGPFV